MIRKTLVAAGIAGALVFAGSAAANAAYTPGADPDDGVIDITVSDQAVTPGSPVTITAGDLDGPTATFAIAGGPSGATLSSIVFAAAQPSVEKDVENGFASATFEAATPGEYTITVASGDQEPQTIAVTVATAAAGGTGSGSGTLPATGGTLPVEALWLGVGVLGLGGIAVTAAVARRRATSSN